MLLKPLIFNLFLLLIFVGMHSCKELPEEIPVEEISIPLKFGIVSFDVEDSYKEDLFKDSEEGQIWTYEKDGDVFMIHLYCGATDSTYKESETNSLSVWDTYFSYRSDKSDSISIQKCVVSGYEGRLITYSNNLDISYIELCFDNLGSKHYYIMITGNGLKESTFKDIMKTIEKMTIKCD